MKRLLCVLVCFICCIFSGCHRNAEFLGEKITLYFPDSQKKNMVTEERVVPEEEDNILEFAVKSLIEGPKTEGYKRAVSEGTRLLGVELSDSIATVNLSGEFNSGTKIDRLWGRYTLINTVCGIKGVRKTQILVDGEAITSISGNEPIGPMGKDDIVTDITQVTKDTAIATLYYADENASALVPEAREIVLKEGEKLEKAVIEALFQGPKNEGLYSVLPQGIRVLSTETKDGVCFLNLSQEFSASGMGSSTEVLSVYSIVNTLCKIEGVEKVQILVEGKKIEEFGGMNLAESLEENKTVLKSK